MEEQEALENLSVGALERSAKDSNKELVGCIATLLLGLAALVDCLWRGFGSSIIWCIVFLAIFMRWWPRLRRERRELREELTKRKAADDPDAELKRARDELEKLARRFRRALDRSDPDKRPMGFEQFPRGTCGDTTRLLGAFLIDQGIMGFEYMHGEQGSVPDDTWRTHAWLQRGTLVIDITADQEPDRSEPVFVLEDSEWHAGWNGTFKGSADFRHLEGPAIPGLRDFYRLLIDDMDHDDD